MLPSSFAYRIAHTAPSPVSSASSHGLPANESVAESIRGLHSLCEQYIDLRLAHPRKAASQLTELTNHRINELATRIDSAKDTFIVNRSGLLLSGLCSTLSTELKQLTLTTKPLRYQYAKEVEGTLSLLLPAFRLHCAAAQILEAIRLPLNWGWSRPLLTQAIASLEGVAKELEQTHTWFTTLGDRQAKYRRRQTPGPTLTYFRDVPTKSAESMTNTVTVGLAALRTSAKALTRYERSFEPHGPEAAASSYHAGAASDDSDASVESAIEVHFPIEIATELSVACQTIHDCVQQTLEDIAAILPEARQTDFPENLVTSDSGEETSNAAPIGDSRDEAVESTSSEAYISADEFFSADSNLYSDDIDGLADIWLTSDSDSSDFCRLADGTRLELPPSPSRIHWTDPESITMSGATCSSSDSNDTYRIATR